MAFNLPSGPAFILERVALGKGRILNLEGRAPLNGGRFHLDWRMRRETLKREHLFERAGRTLGDARFGGARRLGLMGDPAGSRLRDRDGEDEQL